MEIPQKLRRASRSGKPTDALENFEFFHVSQQAALPTFPVSFSSEKHTLLLQYYSCLGGTWYRKEEGPERGEGTFVQLAHDTSESIVAPSSGRDVCGSKTYS